MSEEEIGKAYFNEIKKFLKKPNLIVRKQGTMNKREGAIIFYDNTTGLFAGFENNPLYNYFHLISSYQTALEDRVEFLETSNIGKSLRWKAQLKLEAQKIKTFKDQVKSMEHTFY